MENDERKKEIEIDLVPILKAIWSKLWLIVLVGVCVTCWGAAIGWKASLIDLE